MAPSLRVLAYAALALLAPARAAAREVWWDISYAHDVNPDGRHPRRAIGVNGTWPPPPLEVSSNDTLTIHATNRLDVPSSLHSHGMYFNGTPWFDGAMGVTQCGIPPDATFTYIIPVNTSGQHGTYWIHAHGLGQYTDGLRSPLVIHAPTEVHQYDEEYTVLLGDWYHTEQHGLTERFLGIANPGGAEPVPESAIIYFAQNETYLPGYNENTTINFVPGRTYRLRILNTAAFAMFWFWIDGHDMRIIEADGTDVEEYPIDIISLTAAQRYSILVTARNDTDSNWAIHANMDIEMFDAIPPLLIPNTTSSITYAPGAPLTTRDTLNNGEPVIYVDTPDVELAPIPPEPMLPPPALTIPLMIVFETSRDGNNRAYFNDITWNAPVVPGLFSALSLARGDGGLDPQAAQVAELYGPGAYMLNGGDVVDLVLQNSDAGKHPFHLHGHKFQIVHRATDYTSDDPELNPPMEEGQANPIRRDTLQVPDGQSATLRFVADNPGVWIFHCHIEWHMESGLSIILVSAPQTLLANTLNTSRPLAAPPDYVFSQCAAQGIPTTGNAAGYNSTTDLTGLKIGPLRQDNGWHGKGIAAMTGCVAAAALGMAAVAWYALVGGQMGDEDVMAEVRRKLDAKEARGGVFQRLGWAKKA